MVIDKINKLVSILFKYQAKFFYFLGFGNLASINKFLVFFLNKLKKKNK